MNICLVGGIFDRPEAVRSKQLVTPETVLLDGFRAERAHPLPHPPLSPRQVHRAMVTLGRRSAGDTH